MTLNLQSDNQDGFNLTELLIVIAIIGILAALLLLTLSRSKRKAQQIQCVSNLHQLGLGIQNFVADNQAYPSGIAGTNTSNPGSWMKQLQCGGFDVSKPKTNFISEGVWHCPSAHWSHFPTNAIPMSYGYNVYGSVGTFTNNTTFGLMGHFISRSALFAPLKESEVAVPSDLMAIGDSFHGGVFFGRNDLAFGRNGRASSRHQGRVNVAFCDGHVESPTLEFVFSDTSDAALARWNRDHQPHRAAP